MHVFAAYQTLMQRLCRLSTLSATATSSALADNEAKAISKHLVRLVYPSASWCDKLAELHLFLQKILPLYQQTCCGVTVPPQVSLPAEDGPFIGINVSLTSYSGNELSPPPPDPPKDVVEVGSKKSHGSAASTTRSHSSTAKHESGRKSAATSATVASTAAAAASAIVVESDKSVNKAPVTEQSYLARIASLKMPSTFTENIICVQWYEPMSLQSSSLLSLINRLPEGTMDTNSNLVLMMFAVLRKPPKKRSRLGVIALPADRVSYLHKRYVL